VNIQWRQVVALAQRVTDSRCAFDRNLARDQIGDVAVNGALADFQVVGEYARGDHAAPAQPLDYLKQAIRPPHQLA
jgi:hypothetical protein